MSDKPVRRVSAKTGKTIPIAADQNGGQTYAQWKKLGVLDEKLLLMEGYTRDGITRENLCEILGISRKTLIGLEKNYADIRLALSRGKETVDYAVENALLRNALQGDTTAQMFWLRNRKPAQWRDLKEINNGMQDGLVHIDLSGITGVVGEDGKLKVVKEN